MTFGHEARAKDSDNHKLFYGYVVVLTALCIMAVAFGTRFTFGVFFKPMANEFNWSSAATSGAFSLSVALEGLMAVAMGALTDRFSPRVVLTFSGILLGVGYAAMSQVNSLWQLYLFYGVIIGIGMGGCCVPLVTTIPRWFIKRRAMMTGVVLSGTGIGTLIASPVANRLIYTYSWQTSYLILTGIIMFVIILSAQFLKRDPSQSGLLPYGDDKCVGQKPDDAVAFTLREAIHTPQFWFVTFAFASLGFCIYATNVHIVPSAIERGISATDSAYVLAISGGMSILGRIMLGNVADRIGNRRSMIIGFALMTAALFWMIPTFGFWASCLFAAVFGFGYGGPTSSQSPVVAELFGLKSHGLIFGVCGIGFTIGGALGTLLSGYLFDVTGSYPVAFAASAVTGIIGILFVMIIKPVKRL